MTDCGTERKKRLLKAVEYEKKALQALVSERTAGHIEVIGDEIKAMIKENLLDALFQGREGNGVFGGMECPKTEPAQKESVQTGQSRRKKVEIR